MSDEQKYRNLQQYAFAHQCPEELIWLLEKVVGAKSILEIGSCHGHTLLSMANCMGDKGKVVSIDAGHDIDMLQATVDGLKAGGFDAHLFHGDSTSVQAVAFAREHGPFDFVFIDGGHDFPVCRLDWENYGPMGKVVAFHDIAHPHHDVRHLWEEIKAGNRTEERVLSMMGIGVVYK